MQIVSEKDEQKYEFDLLDPTKLIPEELVPVRIIGKMVLNRNPANFFAETEQVAFHPGHLVSGIDFSNDPLLQGHLFSYTDTQLSRLGGPNFHEIPINRPVAPVHNNQWDGHMRQTMNTGKSSYHPNNVGDGQASASTLQQQSDAIDFINEAYKHCKAIATDGTGAKFLAKTDVFTKNSTADKTPQTLATMGVLMNQTPDDFINAIAQHRFWEREKLSKIA